MADSATCPFSLRYTSAYESRYFRLELLSLVINSPPFLPRFCFRSSWIYTHYQLPVCLAWALIWDLNSHQVVTGMVLNFAILWPHEE